jgi:hypothetical protein
VVRRITALETMATATEIISGELQLDTTRIPIKTYEG